MNAYKLIVAYNGTHYAGWQVQKQKKSVSEIMQKAFFETFNHSCTLTAASRTDAGVHAEGQVILCKTTFLTSKEKLLHAWNNALPDDVLIRSLDQITDNFHPFFNVLYKTYKYTIFTKRPMPHDAGKGWHFRYVINKDLLKEALELFIGKYDFELFCTKEPHVSTLRIISNITVHHYDGKIDILVEGKSFIRHMIRRIVGAAVTVAANHNYTKEHIKQLLHNKKGAYCFQTAPACGLTLLNIVYKQNKTLSHTKEVYE